MNWEKYGIKNGVRTSGWVSGKTDTSRGSRSVTIVSNITNSNISLGDNSVVTNGKESRIPVEDGADVEFYAVVNGNKIPCSPSVTIVGNVRELKLGSGTVKVQGNCLDVSVTTGSVTVQGAVRGDITVKQGSVKHGS